MLTSFLIPKIQSTVEECMHLQASDVGCSIVTMFSCRIASIACSLSTWLDKWRFWLTSWRNKWRYNWIVCSSSFLSLVPNWTASQEVKRLILYQKHDSKQKSHQLRLSPAQYSLTTQSWPKIRFIHCFLSLLWYNKYLNYNWVAW